MNLITLLKIALDRNASDLHLMNGIAPVLRINGEIIILEHEALHPEAIKAMVYDNLDEERKAVLEEKLQLCYSLKIPELGYFRIAIYFELGIIGASIRIGNKTLKSLDELGLPPLVGELTRKSSGLILITGPTGSGKTTTLNSLIDLINRDRRAKIITVEDPIEYIHSNKKSIIVQQELFTDAHNFNDALIHILRQDPDVIAIGEMRDLQTIATALTAAETGHLVLSTLHTPDAAQTIDRIIDVFPPNQQTQIRTQLSNSLEAVISQQLIQRIDVEGRVLAYEIMLATSAVRNIIRENKTQSLDNVISTASAAGMRSMDTSLLDLYQKGIITYDSAASRAKNPGIFRNTSPQTTRAGIPNAPRRI